MATSYISSFQQGEFSRKMDARSDLEVYKGGCRTLQNFRVLPQGGVERRTGTEKMYESNNGAGDLPSRLFPFEFSALTSYVVEIGFGFIFIHDSNAPTGTAPYTPTTINAIPYQATDDLRDLQFIRSFDTMIITHPNRPPCVLERTVGEPDPEFTFKVIEYTYPPLFETNETTRLLEPFVVAPPTWQFGGGVTYNVGDKVQQGTGFYIALVSTTPTSAQDFEDDLIAGKWVEINPFAGGETVDIKFTDNGVAEPLLRPTDLDSEWGVDYRRTAGQQIIKANFSGTTSGYTDPLTVSFATFEVETDGAWAGSIIVERSVNSGDSWENYVIIGDTTGLPNRNFLYVSPLTEAANTLVRVKYTADSALPPSAQLNLTLRTTEPLIKGLIRFTEIPAGNIIDSISTDGVNMTLTMVNDHKLQDGDSVVLRGIPFSGDDPNIQGIVSDSTGDSKVFKIPFTSTGTYTPDADSRIAFCSRGKALIKSDLGSRYTGQSNGVDQYTNTLLWAEGAFSDTNGYPRCAEIYQNRLWFIGTYAEPSTIYASLFGDLFNFSESDTNDSSLKRQIASSEDTQFLIGKKFLFAGSTGTALTIRSANTDELINQYNLDTQPETAYGSSSAQALISNDVIIYAQHNRLNLREMVYSQEQQAFASKNLNILAEHITEGFIVEFFNQKQPTQTIWCVKGDGDIALLTYEKEAEVTGWASIKTDGEFISGCALTGLNEDIIWMSVKRGDKYILERFVDADTRPWYVDSGVEYDGGSTHQDITFTKVDEGQPNERYEFTHLGGIHEGDKIKLTDVNGFDALADKVLTVEHQHGNDYALRTLDDSEYITGSASSFTADIRVVKNTINNLGHLAGKKIQIVSEESFLEEITVPEDATNSTDIEISSYSNNILAGLGFSSILRPMPLEPALVQRLSQSRVKCVSKVTVRFLDTKGAKVGEQGRQPSSFPVVKTTDIVGEPINTVTGERRFFIGSDWDREKVIEVIQDLPYPMTVLSVATTVEVEGK